MSEQAELPEVEPIVRLLFALGQNVSRFEVSTRFTGSRYAFKAEVYHYETVVVRAEAPTLRGMLQNIANRASAYLERHYPHAQEKSATG